MLTLVPLETPKISSEDNLLGTMVTPCYGRPYPPLWPADSAHLEQLDWREHSLGHWQAVRAHPGSPPAVRRAVDLSSAQTPMSPCVQLQDSRRGTEVVARLVE